MAIASIADGLLPLSQTAMMFYDRIGYHDWEGIATDLGERERLVRDLGPHFACILRNHGLLTCGLTVNMAWTVLYYLEKACESQLAAMAAAHAPGQKLVIPSAEVYEHTGRQFDALLDSLAGPHPPWGNDR